MKHPKTLMDLETFLPHLMVYGSPEDVAAVERYIPEKEFRKVLQDAPAGVFTAEAWAQWHKRFGMLPVPPLPRRCFPDGTVGPDPCVLWSMTLRGKYFLEAK